jgi:hypothetical protein
MRRRRLRPEPEKAMALSRRIWASLRSAHGKEYVAPDPESNFNHPHDRLRVTSEFESDEDMNRPADR